MSRKNINYKEIVTQVYNQVIELEDNGKPAGYIPELAKVDPYKFGICISSLHYEGYGMGDFEEKFSIQSIAKVLSLCMAYDILGEPIWKRLGVEPSGSRFNSIFQLEMDNGIPRNPFINAGAIVISDILLSHLQNPKEDFLNFVRNVSEIEDIYMSDRIAQSEASTGFNNAALCNYMKSFKNIENHPDDVLDFYYHLCSIELSCSQLSKLFLFLANEGKRPHDQKSIISKSQSKRINAIMQTCGFYDQSGEFAFKVGLPGKSGVGGGIIAIYPNQYAMAVWSPRLNEKGNSNRGLQFLEAFTSHTERSIF